MTGDHRNRLLTISKAARILGVHPNTLRNWADQGEVAHMLLPNGHRRFHPLDIVRLRDSMHKPARTKGSIQAEGKVMDA